MMQTINPPSTWFVDDPSDFLASLPDELSAYHLTDTSRVTSEPDECLRSVRTGEVATVVAHLNMKDDGLNVLAEVRRLAGAEVECLAITAHKATPAQLQRAEGLLATIVKKEDLPDLLERLRETPPETRRTAQRLKALENMHREWTADLVSKLKEVPDYENAMISSQNGNFTIAELIKDIEELRPRGIEYIRLWRRTLGTLLQIRKKRKP